MINFRSEYQRWLSSDSLTLKEKEELLAIKNDDKEKEFSFYSLMNFGTAGLRSVMGMGVSKMNRFTVAHTTRGVAKLIKQTNEGARGVVIAYDSRNNSEQFAKISASILAYEGIRVYIFNGLRPTPELSFAVRYLNAIAGINITASHNPKEYNGYKAYWEDGAQISPVQAKIVSEARSQFDVLDVTGLDYFDTGVKSGIISLLCEDFDEIYLNHVLDTSVNRDALCEIADEMSVVYTPLHGAGFRLVPEIFRRIGLKHLYTVDEQMVLDGNFPTVVKPNPEYGEVFSLGIKLANKVGSDLIIATDPDSDRVGVMARTKSTDFITLSGNQMGALLLDYVINERKKRGMLSDRSYCVKSIVSTDMANKIAAFHGVKIHEVLTGFKFIGEVIKNYESQGQHDGFILGFEESYGYLLGTYARDKDAVETSMIILEMAAFYKKQGMTLADALESLYRKYGFYAERTIDVYMEGFDGIAKRKAVMDNLRVNSPKNFGDHPVINVLDYKPESDVLYYTLDNDDKIIVRPSGTEPKIKIYILAHSSDRKELELKVERYSHDVHNITNI